MRIRYPESIDQFNLPMSREQWNAAQTSEEPSLTGILYILQELELALGAQAAISPTPASATEAPTVSLGTLQSAVSSLQAIVSTLQAQLAAMPGHYEGHGQPNDALGNDGSTYRDLDQKMDWHKSEGTWWQ